MTTYSVNSACEVLWISRQDTPEVRALFRDEDSTSQEPLSTEMPEVVRRLVQAGALWLAEYSDVLTGQRERTTSGYALDYMYPEGLGASDVITCSWSKDLTSPAGVFSVMVKPRIAYDELIKPGDLFVIFMDDDHRYGRDHRTDGTLITIGLVDAIGITTSVDGSGATIETVQVTGRDFGAILQETMTAFDNAFTQEENAYFTGDYIKAVTERQQTATSPVETVLLLLDLVYNVNATNSRLVGAQWSLPAALNDLVQKKRQTQSLMSLLDVQHFVQVPMFGYRLPDDAGLLQSGNIWSLLESHANRVVNEFFIDIRDRTQEEDELMLHLEQDAARLLSSTDSAHQVALLTKIVKSGGFNRSVFSARSRNTSTIALVHRQMPYDQLAFSKLPVNDLHYTEAFDYDVRTSSHDVANFFRARFPSLPVEYQELAVGGIRVNVQSVMSFGIRRMDIESQYPFTSSDAGTAYANGDSGPENFVDSFKYYVGLMSTWYAANELLFSGQISRRFRPEIRVGTRLRYTRVDGEVVSYYVQAVHHSFSVNPGASRTQLTIVRGRIEGRNDLPNNLTWRSGYAIPPELLSYGEFNESGFRLAGPPAPPAALPAGDE